MCLGIFDETPEFCSIHIRIFLYQNGTDRTKESTCSLCRLAHFQSGKSQKAVSIIATLIIPILWSESKQKWCKQ